VDSRSPRGMTIPDRVAVTRKRWEEPRSVKRSKRFMRASGRRFARPARVFPAARGPVRIGTLEPGGRTGYNPRPFQRTHAACASVRPPRRVTGI
jgi:hypothetical protein